MEITWSILSILYLLHASQHRLLDLLKERLHALHIILSEQADTCYPHLLHLHFLSGRGGKTKQYYKKNNSVREQREFLTYDAPTFKISLGTTDTLTVSGFAIKPPAKIDSPLLARANFYLFFGPNTHALHREMRQCF